MAGIGYDFAPTLLTRQVDKFIPLRADQRQLVDQHFRQLHGWHRASQLPAYATTLTELDDRFRSQVDVNAVKAVRDRVPAIWAPVAERLAEPMADLLLTIDASQIEESRKRFAVANKKMRADYASANPKEREAARVKRYIERAEFFLGSLSAAQEQEIKRMALALPPNEDLWMEEREARQKRFIELAERVLRERPSKAEAARWSGEFLSGLWVSQDPQRRQALERATAAADQITLRVFEQANEPQRRFLSEKLRSYARDVLQWSKPRTTESRAASGSPAS
jgi:hypothetical protein